MTSKLQARGDRRTGMAGSISIYAALQAGSLPGSPVSNSARSAMVCLKLTCSCQKIGTPASLARWLLAPFRFG